MVVLEFLKAIIDNFGSAIVVPFIIFIIALIFRVKPAKAFLSGRFFTDHRGIYTNHHTIGTKYVKSNVKCNRC